MILHLKKQLCLDSENDDYLRTQNEKYPWTKGKAIFTNIQIFTNTQIFTNIQIPENKIYKYTITSECKMRNILGQKARRGR